MPREARGARWPRVILARVADPDLAPAASYGVNNRARERALARARGDRSGRAPMQEGIVLRAMPPRKVYKPHSDNAPVSHGGICCWG